MTVALHSTQGVSMRCTASILASTLLGACLVAGVTTADSLGLLFALCAQVWMGDRVLALARVCSPTDPIDRLMIAGGTGSAIGALLSSLWYDLNGSFHYACWLGIGIAASILSRAHKPRTLAHPIHAPIRDVVVVLLVASLSMASFRPTLLISAGFLWLLLTPRVMASFNQRRACILLPLAWCLGPLASRLLQGQSNPLSYLTNSDDLDFEAYARSVASIGRASDLMIAGEPLKYHFLSFGWLGGLTEAASAEAYSALAVFAPMLSALFVVGLGRTWLTRLIPASPIGMMPLLVLAASARPLEATYFMDFSSFSMIITNVWLLTLLGVLAQPPQSRLSSVVLIPLFAAVALGKVHTGVVLIGGTLVGYIWLRVRSEPPRSVVLWSICPALLGLAAWLSPLAPGSSGYSQRLELTLNSEFLGGSYWLPISLIIAYLRSPIWPAPRPSTSLSEVTAIAMWPIGLLAAVAHRAHSSYSNLFLLALLVPAAALTLHRVDTSFRISRSGRRLAIVGGVSLGLAQTLALTWMNVAYGGGRRLDLMVMLLAVVASTSALTIYVAGRARGLSRGLATSAVALLVGGYGVGCFLASVPRDYQTRWIRGDQVFSRVDGYARPVLDSSVDVAAWLAEQGCSADQVGVATRLTEDGTAQPADARILVARSGRQMYVSLGADQTYERRRRLDIMASLAEAAQPWKTAEWSEVSDSGVTLIVLDRRTVTTLPPRTEYADQSFFVVSTEARDRLTECATRAREFETS